jgi:hypothetical protein
MTAPALNLPPAPSPTSAPTLNLAIPAPQLMGYPVQTQQRADTFIDRMLAQYGTAENALKQMAQQIVQFSDHAARLETENRDLKNKLPPDGSQVIPKEAVPLWQAVTETKLDADNLKRVVKEHGEMGAKLATSSRAEVNAKAAQALGNANPEVLALALETREVEMRPVAVVKNGKQEMVDAPFVRPKNQPTAAWEPLATVVDRDFSAAMKAALRAQPTTAAPAGAPAPALPPAGGTWPVTPAAATPGDASDFVSQFQKKSQGERDARPSALGAVLGRGPAQNRPAPDGSTAAPATPR